jgi:hypothetical protein
MFFWRFIFVQSLKFVYRWLASEVVLGLGFSYRGTFRMTQKNKTTENVSAVLSGFDPR